jgi:hypothetical protein
VGLVEEGEINRVLVEDKEEEIVKGIEAIEGIDKIKAIEEAKAAIFSGADPNLIDLSSKESIVDIAIIVLILIIYQIATNSLLEDWQIH